MATLNHFRTIADYHRFAGLPAPHHPLVSVIDYAQVRYQMAGGEHSWVQDFYSIGLKRGVNARLWYGRQEYDFEEGLMSFVAPGRRLTLRPDPAGAPSDPSGRLLLIHPEFLYGSRLSERIGAYDLFHYALHEALFLSPREETVITEVLRGIEREYRTPIDTFSQQIIVTQIEQLLAYAERFYARQFVTRRAAGHRIVAQLEDWLAETCRPERLERDGVPRVTDLATHLHLSPNYLATLVRDLTGLSPQQHIQRRLIERAKELLLTTDAPVSTVAYQLGFNHPASFSKLFRREVALSPSDFRARARV